MLDTPANCYYDKQTGLIVEDPKGTEPDATVSGGCPHEAGKTTSLSFDPRLTLIA